MQSYDILHVHTDYWGALLVGPLSKLLERPSIFQIVRMGVDDPTTLVRQSLGYIKLWCFKRYDRILCISEALRQECLRQGIGAGNAIMQINPVDSIIFSPSWESLELSALRRKLNLPEGARIILSVGSVIPRKGTDLLIDAFLLLAKSHSDLFLVLAGPVSKAESASVDETFVEGIRQKMANAGLAKRMIFTGRIDDDDVLADYYRSADIFALPTHQEGLPNALLEAMSSGLPIVATHLPGSTDLIISDGETGFLIPLNDASTLGKKLQSLLENPQQGREVGYAARTYAVQTFGFDAWQMKLTSIYSSMFNKKTCRGSLEQ